MTEHDTANWVITQSERIGGKVNFVYGPFPVQQAKELCLTLRAEESKERPMLFYFNVHLLMRSPPPGAE